MRLFEVLTLTVLLMMVTGYFFPVRKRPRWMAGLPALAVLTLVAHLIFEKYRWQMMPVYVLMALLILAAVYRVKKQGRAQEKPSSKRTRVFVVVLASLGMLYLAASASLLGLMPVRPLQRPTGPYSVGTTFLYLKDNSRHETLTEDPNDHREFMARIWYPANPIKGTKPIRYKNYQKRVGSILESDSASLPGGPPDFVFSHLVLVKSNSYADAPFAGKTGSCPVIGFSAGFLSDLDEYQLQFEELASQGYVVFSCDQPFESRSNVRPDGQIVPFRRSHAEEFQRCSKAVLPLWKKFWETSDELERASLIREILKTETFMDRIFRIRTADMQFAINEFEKMNSGERDSLFRGRLDMSRIGVFGHSGGGAVAGQCCVTDLRFKAGVNMDGFQFGDVSDSTVEQPFMFIYSEPFADTNAVMMKSFVNSSYVLTIQGSRHLDFSDNPFVLPITKKMGMSGPIPAKRMTEILNRYLLAFFDTYLRNKKVSLLDGPSPDYPEVQFKKHSQ